MPVTRFIFTLIAVLFAAAITLWLGALVAASVQMPGLTLMVMVPIALTAFLGLRVALRHNRRD
ncbi:hypothetical protein C8N32_12718 [Rhodovulum imhoffii]|uniref:Uncharacterized protein n=1 Tax=Rhodovulum imhoffii TaxID=365340 RepID=A0A2T5BNR7_9RHOB|nr:hypothetical protein [Rhodovulum imhoffii]MBK5932955.1 hypothetical protein [Rhodovulum imhoffii]PTN00646.1 hypothetical protein C8N32_12718 [Rhodovulum imhoffii]